MTQMTLTALYDARAEADLAAEHLASEAGVALTDVTITAQDAGASGIGTAEGTGFFGSLKNLLMPEADRHAFSEGLRRGGFLLTVQVDQDGADRAMDILEQHGAVDIDDRQQTWRTEGWSGQQVTSGTETLADGTVVTAATGASSASQAPPATTAPAPQSAPVTPSMADRPPGSNEEKIDVVEETLRVGKRAVGGGRVRVRSYVVETPVEEQVTLRDEHVSIERRPMDHAPTAADEALFDERVIEATEVGEEAVIAKEARVTEEVVVRKGVEERVETVHDAVRRTKVEVHDDRAAKAAGTAATPASPRTRKDSAPRR
jgi:uncharacterized protein (TIGR02271 family)